MQHGHTTCSSLSQDSAMEFVRHVAVLAVRIIILMDCMPVWMPESCGVMLNLASAVDVEGRTN